jgi:hypothetical protein
MWGYPTVSSTLLLCPFYHNTTLQQYCLLSVTTVITRRASEQKLFGLDHDRTIAAEDERVGLIYFVEGRLERTDPYPVARSSYSDRARPDDAEDAPSDVTVNKRGWGRPGAPLGSPPVRHRGEDKGPQKNTNRKKSASAKEHPTTTPDPDGER